MAALDRMTFTHRGSSNCWVFPCNWASLLCRAFLFWSWPLPVGWPVLWEGLLLPSFTSQMNGPFLQDSFWSDNLSLQAIFIYLVTSPSQVTPHWVAFLCSITISGAKSCWKRTFHRILSLQNYPTQKNYLGKWTGNTTQKSVVWISTTARTVSPDYSHI